MDNYFHALRRGNPDAPVPPEYLSQGVSFSLCTLSVQSGLRHSLFKMIQDCSFDILSVTDGTKREDTKCGAVLRPIAVLLVPICTTGHDPEPVPSVSYLRDRIS